MNSMESLPKIAVIVPLFNEEDLVKQKIENLKEMTYDQDKMDIYFLNGLSTDNSSSEIAHHISGMANWHLIETSCTGKIHQINYGLSQLKKDVDIIVSTDMDAILEPDVFVKFVHEFNSDERVAVVGANISPQNSIPIDQHYWNDQNVTRILESILYTSSIVVAPCYAFKAFLIKQFPDDCVADDIFVAFKANTKGYITRYIKSAKGTETRCPKSISEFYRHKYRKGNAFLIEIFRFLYLLPYMSTWWKMIYLTKMLQLVVLPWILPYFVLSTISLALSGWGLFQLALFGLLFILVFLIISSYVMQKTRIRYLNIPYQKKKSIFMPFIFGNLLLILVSLGYPFYRQTSDYKKIQ